MHSSYVTQNSGVRVSISRRVRHSYTEVSTLRALASAWGTNSQYHKFITVQWNTLESTGVEYQQFVCLIQDNFLTQHVLEPTRGARVLDLVLFSQKELVERQKQERVSVSDHNQLHLNIKI